MTEVKRILDAMEQGDAQAADRLLPLVYDELRRLAALRLAHEASGQTLQATALVHEAYLRLLGDGAAAARWESRGHFFAAAAEAMRRILVERARRKRAKKHGGALKRHDPAQEPPALPEPAEDIVALDEALEKLARQDPRKCELVKLRYFAGMTIDEAAGVLGISSATAKRYWTYTRTWLYREITR